MSKAAIVTFLLSTLLLSGKGTGFLSVMVPTSASGLEISQELETLHARRVFVDSLSTEGLPGGMVWQVNCGGDTPRIKTDLSILQMDEKLNLIINAFPQYRLRKENGAINLILESGYPVLLQAKLSSYQVNDAPTAVVALEKLLSLPEFKEAASRLGLKPALSFGGYSSPRGRKITLSLTNVTVYEALNAIARANGRAIWNYTEFVECDGKKEYSIKFILQ